MEDAHSDILFGSQKLPLSARVYGVLKAMVLKSAGDFLSLYSSVPDKDRQIKESRKTFYGELPATASAMYRHTKNFNHDYFGEIGIHLTQNEDIYLGRKDGFLELESRDSYLKNKR
ncbi:MAG: hypothetical protein GX819_00615, partial [Clostridiaceae bacterium]|nr:hypothetical protein [Clostridiaceae bacterium]